MFTSVDIIGISDLVYMIGSVLCFLGIAGLAFHQSTAKLSEMTVEAQRGVV